MKNNSKEFDFELNLNFEDQKNPVEAFGQIAKMYDKLLSIDQQILYNILPSAKIEYELVGLEFSSIKSKVNQLFKSVPDDVLKDITNPGKLFGLLLVFIKHQILKATETNEVKSKDTLEKVTEKINSEINKLSSSNLMILEVNNYFVLNAIKEIGDVGHKLKNNESFEFKSREGTAKIKNKSSINMAKILYELGGESFEQNRVEILKVKTLDLLSDRASWKLIRQGKQIEVKIIDKEWLDRYHNRQVVIQPNDYLRLDLKIIYSTNTTTSNPIMNYKALKVFEVIPPENLENNNQIDLFKK